MKRPDLVEAQDALFIQSVNLVDSSIKTQEDKELTEIDRRHIYTQSFDGVSKVQEFEIEDKNKKKIFKYQINYALGVRLLSNSGEDIKDVDEDTVTPLIQIEANFGAIYFSRRALTEAELEAFCEENVGFNVWPYWREYVQSSCCRLGFNPPISVPLKKHKSHSNNISSKGGAE